MTIEEKAHAYDVALARAKGMYESRDDAELAAYIFPELTESEDERIIEQLLYIVKDYQGYAPKSGLGFKECLAWLEKQKEQTVIDKQWEELQSDFRNINEAFEDGKKEVISHPERYNLQKEQKPAWQEVKGRRGRIGDTPEYIRKKAENFLSKMESPYDADDICSAYETGAMENAKPAEWSEGDEAMIKSILYVLESYVSQSESASSPSLITTYPTYYKEIDWLKSLRPSWKPSEEQMKALQNAVALTACDKELARLYNQLKKL